ncbi:1-(5-phosphoribosyl)-5-amino-4-imidazole-carboxylate carboxylase [Ornatilinea apprima]|uniref:1-(5-phosphoribosyl)-5-amino-4-imidazole-carboxylate carboxylase n=1 Tax=Ornatilinea apprima TaxID=1134406 RepID=A0A0P6XQG7_9CHLR|nr:nickel pincer cofactor biosynthesis protein LarB [Ornatilinea apprima]KPL79019.1 1-(5-phosphoribosyl)-5-amino-4-imidazole-carboxylate carboxylase [Ornatilinea apprima]
MEENRIKELLESVRSGKVEVDEALDSLVRLPYEQVGDFAQLDMHRGLRRGFPEVVFGQGKTAEQITQIVNRLSERNERVLVTRLSAEVYAQIREELPDDAVYHQRPRALVINRANLVCRPGILVACAGTADTPVAEEAALTAELMGNQVERLYDVGVAGLHRLLDKLPMLRQARVIVVAAGMEGALASVVSGLVDAPVIAVPTSVGYGASFHGLSALLAMLNSCSSGIAVVNIDNGFGAGAMAAMINRLDER